MALILKKKASVPPLPEDIYLGVCYAVIDIGMQYEQFQGKSAKLKHKIMLIWEITGEEIEIDGKKEPRVISNEYTFSFEDKANLKKLIDSWFGKDSYSEENGFDIKNFLGKPCQLEITVNDKDYNRIANIMRLARGQTAHEPKELLYYEIGDESTHDVFDKIPEWIRDKIKKSVDFENIVDIPDKTPGSAEPPSLQKRAEKKTNEKSKTEEVPF